MTKTFGMKKERANHQQAAMAKHCSPSTIRSAPSDACLSLPLSKQNTGLPAPAGMCCSGRDRASAYGFHALEAASLLVNQLQPGTWESHFAKQHRLTQSFIWWLTRSKDAQLLGWFHPLASLGEKAGAAKFGVLFAAVPKQFQADHLRDTRDSKCLTLWYNTFSWAPIVCGRRRACNMRLVEIPSTSWSCGD